MHGGEDRPCGIIRRCMRVGGVEGWRDRSWERSRIVFLFSQMRLYPLAP